MVDKTSLALQKLIFSFIHTIMRFMAVHFKQRRFRLFFLIGLLNFFPILKMTEGEIILSFFFNLYGAA